MESSSISTQVLSLIEIEAKGIKVFDNRSNFMAWMNQPIKAFANKTPMSLLHSKHGVEMILDELGRIEHGIFS